jgi:hypothetical protein
MTSRQLSIYDSRNSATKHEVSENVIRIDRIYFQQLPTRWIVVMEPQDHLFALRTHRIAVGEEAIPDKDDTADEAISILLLSTRVFRRGRR